MIAGRSLLLQQCLVLRQQFPVARGDLLVALQALMRVVERRLAGCVGHPDRARCNGEHGNYGAGEYADGELPLSLPVEFLDHCGCSSRSVCFLATVATI